MSVSPPSLGIPDKISNIASSAIKSLQNSTISDQGVSYPWSGKDSLFFKYITIKPDRWDQLFPYRLLVVDALNGNTVIGGSSNTNVSVTAENNIVIFQPLGNQWVFTLPITPQQLSITDQYSINTSFTLRGVLEEHSGVRFKLINAAGTMGIWPYRESVVAPPSSPSILQSVFGGTIEAIGNVVDQVSRVINTATSGHPSGKPVTKRPEESSAGSTSTGYYHAVALQQFLEQYAEAKKDPHNAGWRLVFDIPKQNTSYVVTPMPYVWQQNANKPLEITYSFQLKAWRRIDLKQKVSPVVPNIQPITPGILQRILNTISESRKTMSAASNLIGAVRSDSDRVFDILRQASLFVKDAAGVVLTAVDLPLQMINDLKSAIVMAGANLDKNNVIDAAGHTGAEIVQKWKDLKLTLEGLSPDAVSGGQLGPNLDPNIALGMFKKPADFFTLLDLIPLTSLTLTNAQQAAVDQEIDDARKVTVDTLKKNRNTILQLALQLSNSFGTGDAYFSQVYRQPAPTSRVQPITLDEYQLLKQLYDMVQSYDILTSTTQIDDKNRQTNMDYVAGLADLAGIPFNTATSKILAPVPFGLTIEAIALRYLGDAQRWLEIVTLNNLRDPYIDENGFQLSLLSNASGRQITVDSIDNLYIGQRVVIISSTQIPSARIILDINKLSDTSFLLTLDGLADLDNFVTADQAYLQVYLPGTVNSQQKIYIPSNLPVPNDPNIIPPSSTTGDPLTGLSKVDWLLTETGDLAINNYGDFRYASGITNIIQSLRIKIGTKKNTVVTHPEFGLGIKVGMMNNEFTVQDIYNSLVKLIQEDPRFQGLDSLQISLNGPTLNINMGVLLAGQNGVFPINFNL